MASINQHSPSLRCLLMEAWIHFNESVRNPVWISCELKKKSSRCMFISSTPISSGLRISPTVDSKSLNILMSLSVLRFALTFLISAVLVEDQLSPSFVCFCPIIFVLSNNLVFKRMSFKYQIILNVTLKLAFHGNNFHFPVHAHIRDTL